MWRNIFWKIEENTPLPGASKDVADEFVLEKFKCVGSIIIHFRSSHKIDKKQASFFD